MDYLMKIGLGIICIFISIFLLIKEFKRSSKENYNLEYNDLKIWGGILGFVIIGVALIYDGLS